MAALAFPFRLRFDEEAPSVSAGAAFFGSRAATSVAERTAKCRARVSNVQCWGPGRRQGVPASRSSENTMCLRPEVEATGSSSPKSDQPSSDPPPPLAFAGAGASSSAFNFSCSRSILCARQDSQHRSCGSQHCAMTVPATTHLRLATQHRANVTRVLRLQHLDQIMIQHLVPPALHVHALLRPALDHAKVELILVAAGGLLAQLVDPVLLGVKVPRTLDVVGVLLEEAEFGSVGGLGTFPVERGGLADEGGRRGLARWGFSYLCCRFCWLSLSATIFNYFL